LSVLEIEIVESTPVLSKLFTLKTPLLLGVHKDFNLPLKSNCSQSGKAPITPEIALLADLSLPLSAKGCLKILAPRGADQLDWLHRPFTSLESDINGGPQ
jgi:hypothetical protein